MPALAGSASNFLLYWFAQASASAWGEDFSNVSGVTFGGLSASRRSFSATVRKSLKPRSHRRSSRRAEWGALEGGRKRYVITPPAFSAIAADHGIRSMPQTLHRHLG